ncbi:hypothetical protein DEM27_28265 [Metarhizobium album]|uniref:Uncharacterized protein n=1 Tax=Metarhizobium album TaxID=2182425 RepID=A0A2U2DIB2_9HYPH|nr:hypothetical protein DEM27_28265 [Rhizobium album]
MTEGQGDLHTFPAVLANLLEQSGPCRATTGDRASHDLARQWKCTSDLVIMILAWVRDPVGFS